MKFLSNIGWFLFDVAVWIVKFFDYVIKKIIKVIKYFFNRENFQKNKIIYLMVITLIIFLSGFYIFKKYKIIFVPRDEKNQSVAEKAYLNALKRTEIKQTDTKNQVAPRDTFANETEEGGAISKRVSLQGSVKKVGEGEITIITDKQEEKIIITNEKTRIMPSSKKLEVDQSVMVLAHLENEETIADWISVRSTTNKIAPK